MQPDLEPYKHPDEENFKTRTGIATAPLPDATEGVRADWHTLLAAVSKPTEAMKFYVSGPIPLDPGLVKIDFTWTNGASFVDARIFVSSVGPTQARERLVSVASSTQMMKIPFERGPSDLGDVAVQSVAGPSRTFIWAFRNVCVQVDNGGSGFPVEPVARAIQRFMETNVIAEVRRYAPKAESVELSPTPIQVGNKVTLQVTLAKGTTVDSLFTSMDQPGESLLDEKDIQPLRTTYRAELPGKSRIDVVLADRKTLLSSALSVPLEVLP